MAKNELVTIRRCGPVWEAEMIRDRLQSAGIQAFVQGAETNRSLSYVGVALGGVKVQVAADDVDAAERVLIEDERQRTTAGNWQCPRCDELNEPSFDVCWSCAMPRGDTPALGPDGAESSPAGASLLHGQGPPATSPSRDPYRTFDDDRRLDDAGEARSLGTARLLASLLLLAALAALVLFAIASRQVR